ncbi:three-helix bundle dimerization domain-containing protein [Arthrobacter sp. R-11]|uniref:three-helix bundle dimerization domain-containing protein n=1 Tax=Arthrobacter sp. R-11 TaxID=3404053 RepID=UPI003CEC367C
MAKESEAQAVLAVIERLVGRFPDLDRSDIEAVVTDEHGKLSEGPIRDYVPVLVERAAKARLRT